MLIGSVLCAPLSLLTELARPFHLITGNLVLIAVALEGGRNPKSDQVLVILVLWLQPQHFSEIEFFNIRHAYWCQQSAMVLHVVLPVVPGCVTLILSKRIIGTKGAL